MERSQDDKHSNFISMCVNAKKSAPKYLSHRQTNDYIDIISRALGRSKMFCKEIIGYVMPNGCVPQFTKPTKETQFLDDSMNLILSLYNGYEKKLIAYMRELKCRGNTNHIKYDLFWWYCILVVDL